MSETKEQQSSDALPEAHFEGQASPPDWRETEDEDPDDEEIDTPEDVIMMLGFDPAESEDERLDAEFEESDHPRDQSGRFAQTAEGAAAGRDYHLGEEKKWLEKREGTVYRPHRRAAAAYEEARGHYEKGQTHRGQAAHREAESHGGAAERRAARLLKSEKKPEPLSREQVASNSVFETIDELDKGGAPDERYRQILSTGSKTALKSGETWRDRVVKFAEGLNRIDAQLSTQAEAHYTVAGTVEEHCGICEHFEAPTACSEIEGPVVFSGWCRLFESKT